MGNRSFLPWSSRCQPTPVFLPGTFHGQRSLVNYSPWGRKESDVMEHTHAPHQHKLQSQWGTFLKLSLLGREKAAQVDNPVCGFRHPQQSLSDMASRQSSARSWYMPAAWVVWYQNEIQRPEGAWVQVATNFRQVPSGASGKPTG